MLDKLVVLFVCCLFVGLKTGTGSLTFNFDMKLLSDWLSFLIVLGLAVYQRFGDFTVVILAVDSLTGE